MISQEEFRQLVLARLQERGVNVTCELCKTNDWIIFDSPLAVIIADPGGGISLPVPQIPAAGLICKNCGNVRLHALGALDLIDVLQGAHQPASK